MTKFTPVFAKDGDTYIVPDSDFIQDTAELADVAGVGAGLASQYGLNYTGRTEELSDEGKYLGPYSIATIRDKQAFIISGQSLVTAVEQGTAENVPVFPPLTVETKEQAVALLTGGDHTGPDVVDAL